MKKKQISSLEEVIRIQNINRFFSAYQAILKKDLIIFICIRFIQWVWKRLRTKLIFNASCIFMLIFSNIHCLYPFDANISNKTAILATTPKCLSNLEIKCK